MSCVDVSCGNVSIEWWCHILIKSGGDVGITCGDVGISCGDVGISCGDVGISCGDSVSYFIVHSLYH